MISKYVLCFAVLVAAIEARPQYVAISIEEYEALINGQAESQSHSYRLASDTPHIRQKRSNDQFTPMESSQRQQYRPSQYITQQYEPSRYITQQYEPSRYITQQYEPSVINEIVVEPEYEYAPVHRYNGGYKQQNRQQQYAASVINEVAAEPERLPAAQQDRPRPRPQYRPQRQQRPQPQQRPQQEFEASHLDSVSPLRPFTGGYQGTPQQYTTPNQLVYVKDDSHDESFSHADLDQEGSATHEKRDSAYGPSGDDHVDYGAYTGSHGAFGWYSDHPVLIHR